MRFRPLGKTGLRLSVVGLGGHFRTRDGGRYWDSFPGDEVPAEVAANRRAVVSASLDAGINHVDITTSAECLAYGAALRGRRDRMVLGADDYAWGARNPGGCTAQRLVENVERCLRRLGTDHLDIWRATTDMHGRNTDAHVAAMFEAADRLRAAGKIRFFAMSSHHPGWLRRVTAGFDGIDAVMFPCTAITDRAPPAAGGRDQVSEQPNSPTPAREESLFDVVRRRGVGAITIKPFAGGALFGGPPDSTVSGRAPDDRSRLARLTLRHILARHPEVTGVIAGLNTVAEVEQAAAATSHWDDDLTPEEAGWLVRTTRTRLDVLPDGYRWLRDWDRV